jgi:hypothetical protein
MVVIVQISGSITDDLHKAVKKDSPSRTWPVYRDYDVEVDQESGKCYVVASVDLFEGMTDEAAHHGHRVKRWRGQDLEQAARTNYLPLKKPELLVELANIADNTITPEAVVGWAKYYGLLACSREEDVLERPGLIGQEAISGWACRESVSGFARAAGEVRACLRTYEALRRDEDLNLEKLSSEVGPLPGSAVRLGERKQGHERAWLFGVLGRMIQMRLHEHCYPQFNVYTSYGYPTGRFALSWGFYNLLGAIWIHMAWLLEAAESSVRFCRLPDCRRVITFDPGKSADEIGTIKDADGRFKRNARGKYKTRSDRIYCRHPRICKQKYYSRKNAGWQGYS